VLLLHLFDLFRGNRERFRTPLSTELNAEACPRLILREQWRLSYLHHKCCGHISTEFLAKSAILMDRGREGLQLPRLSSEEKRKTVPSRVFVSSQDCYFSELLVN
jgi:hypothetical protein